MRVPDATVFAADGVALALFAFRLWRGRRGYTAMAPPEARLHSRPSRSGGAAEGVFAGMARDRLPPFALGRCVGDGASCAEPSADQPTIRASLARRARITSERISSPATRSMAAP